MARHMIGTVVSHAQDKTIVVSTERRVTHPVYKKQYTVTKKYQVHDEKNEALTGDRVSIQESRPVSRHKCWTLDKIIERPEGATDVMEFSDEKKLQDEKIVKTDTDKSEDKESES